MSILDPLFRRKKESEEADEERSSSDSSSVLTNHRSEPHAEPIDESEEVAEAAAQEDDSAKGSPDDAFSLTPFEVPLREVQRIAPHAFLEKEIPADVLKTRFRAHIENAYDQLASGKIYVTLGQLVEEMPPEYIKSDLDLEEMISIPLPLVVDSIHPEELTTRTTKTEKFQGMEDLRNELVGGDGNGVFATVQEAPELGSRPLMASPDGSAHAPAAPEPAAEEEAAEEEAAEPSEPETPEEQAPKVEESDSPVHEEEERGSNHIVVRVHSVDINTASADEMTEEIATLPNYLARRIASEREDFGPFLSAYDLSRVRGIGRQMFERITGLAWRYEMNDTRYSLRSLFGVSKERVPDIHEIARRMAEMDGFDGCIVGHMDGYVMATSWEPKGSSNLAAFAPQYFKGIPDYTKKEALGEVHSMTFFSKNRNMTIVRWDPLYLIAVHTGHHVSRRQIAIAQRTGFELGQRYRYFASDTDLAQRSND